MYPGVTGDNDNQKSSFTGWQLVMRVVSIVTLTQPECWARGPDMLYTFYLSVICCLIPRLATDDEDWILSQMRTDLKSIKG